MGRVRPSGAGGTAATPGPRLVLGTAGHIDHGKSTLVRALTGVDPDRLPEEKARGITIELGFARLDLGGGLVLGVVDVPGHERLVRTMVAGATGIDLVLLVVAADEGVMPQTREHVAICRLLGLERGVVALTKTDTVPEDVAELAAEEARELLADTPLEGAPVVPVSAATGAGLDALRAALADAARAAAARTPRTGPPRLPIDRVFTMRGFGTVVTGTLVGAPLRVGEAVELMPAGRRARIRGLQRHGEAADEIPPGARCAVNLQGVDVDEVARGDVLTHPGALVATRTLDVELEWLSEAPPIEGVVSAEILAGTTERRARVIPLGRARVAPGERTFARVHLDAGPMALLPGDRFVVRGFARTETGGHTLGGGRVLDVSPPRRRRTDPALVRDLEALSRRDPETDVRVRVARAGLAGLSRGELARTTGLVDLDRLLARLTGEGAVVATSAGTLLSPEALEALEARIEAALGEHHRREPLRPGMPRAALRGALPPNVPPDAVELALSRLTKAERVAGDGEVVRLASHRPELGPAERALAERLREGIAAAGLEPPSAKEWAERLGAPVDRVRELLSHLERGGELVRTRDDFWFSRAAVEALRERVTAHLREHGELTTPDYKALIGTTRKHAVPLMELFDNERLTLRVGNKRVLRGARS